MPSRDRLPVGFRLRDGPGRGPVADSGSWGKIPASVPGRVMRPVRVAVVDEHEVFRKGLSSCLAEDPTLLVVVDTPAGPLEEPVDVAVVSAHAAARERFECPLVVCGGGSGVVPPESGGLVMAVLPRASLTPEQLIGAVHAAAAGL